MPSVLIVSDDEDFYPVLAEQLDKRLAYASRQVDSQTHAKQKLEGHALIVSDQVLSPSDWPCPVIVAEKPVRLYDLLAQIASMVHKASFPEIMDIGQGCQLHSRLKQLMHGPSGRVVDVTDKEIQLLKALVDGGDSGVGRDSLLKTVWGFDSDVDTHTLETHIYRLRGKLKDACDSDSMIEAFDGGYKMVK